MTDASRRADSPKRPALPQAAPVPRRIRESPDLYVAFLEARVEALEEALVSRSEQLRRLQRVLPPAQLIALTRAIHDLPPLPRHAYDADAWTETTHLVEAEVEETLRDLWQSLAPDAEGSSESV